MYEERILGKMSDLEGIIGIKFDKIELLACAMDRNEISRPFSGKGKKSYSNEYYALIGDAIIKITLAEKLNKMGFKTSGEITEIKKSLENNDIFHEISTKFGFWRYAFKDNKFATEHQASNRVSYGKHDSFVEAITAAIYYDKGFQESIKWINDWIIPKIDILKDKEKLLELLKK